MILLSERKKSSHPFNSVWGSVLDVGKNLGVVGTHKMYLGITQLQCKEGRKKHQKVTGEPPNVVGLARLTKKKIEKTQMTNIRKGRGAIN